MVLLNVYPTTNWNVFGLVTLKESVTCVRFLQVICGLKPKSGHVSVNSDAAYKQIQPRD